MQYEPHTKLDTKGAADYTGVAKSTLEKLRLTGGGPAYLKPNRSVIYQVSDLDHWLDKSRRTSTSAATPLPTTARHSQAVGVSDEVADEIRKRYC